MPRGYGPATTSVYLMNHHFVWSPRYRRGLLVGQIAARLKALIAEKADELGYRVLQLEVMPDHVHLFASGSPTMSANRIVGAIKGYSSRVLRREFPVLLKMPTLWTRSYFVSTAGDVSAKVIEQYIRSQRGTRP